MYLSVIACKKVHALSYEIEDNANLNLANTPVQHLDYMLETHDGFDVGGYCIGLGEPY